MINKSQILDVNSPTANMYGCEPCPKCGSQFRASYLRPTKDDKERVLIECDDCGHHEQAIEIEEE